MSDLKRLIHEIHGRSLWQVLGIYLLASWVVFEVVQTVTEGLGLPQWFPAFAALLLLIGLPVVLATAFVQQGISPTRRHDPTLMLGAEGGAEARPREVAGARRLFTWRNAISGGVLALALWGVVATGWYVLYGEARGSHSVDMQSVAVLPFVNVSANSADEYFSDGMTFEIISHLSKIVDLKVISRTSIMQYKGTTKNIRQIGQELDVAAVVEGEVQRAGDRIRINAQLIDASSDEHLWTEQYNRELTDVFAIQSDVAQQIARALRATLTPAEAGRIEAKPTENLEAYESYLMGRSHWNKRTGYGLTKAIEYFEEAIAQDDSYALAYAGLSDAYILLPAYDAKWTIDDAYPRARNAALRALALDSALAEAHTSLAAVQAWSDWDWSGAEEGFQRAIHLSPSYATAHHWYGWNLAALGRFEEALSELARARELDPLSPIINADLGHHLYYARRSDESVQQIERALELDPTFLVAHLYLGKAHLQLSMFDEAIADFQRALTFSRNDTHARALLGYTYAVAGLRQEALNVLDDVMELAEDEPVPSVLIAILHMGLGQNEQALEWLEKAQQKRDSWWTVYYISADPLFDSFRSDPRFTSLLEIHDLYEDPVTKVRRVREKLTWGEVRASTPARNVNGSFHEVTTDKMRTRSETGGEFRVSYDREKKTATLDVFDGRVQVSTSSRTRSAA